MAATCGAALPSRRQGIASAPTAAAAVAAPVPLAEAVAAAAPFVGNQNRWMIASSSCYYDYSASVSLLWKMKMENN